MTSPNGGSLSYQFFLCEDPTFSDSDCTSTLVTSAQTVIGYARVEGMLPLVFFGTVLGGIGLRRRKWLIMAIYSLAIVGLISGCGGGGGGGDTGSGGDPTSAEEISVSVSGLKPATRYYWKVVTSDGIKTVESSIQTFTTR